MSDVSSPCVRVCVLDPVEKICLGCGRTIAEVTQWTRFSDDERRSVRKQLGARLKRLKKAT